MGKIRLTLLELDETILDGQILLFTTNGNIKKDGKAIMGRGIARWVKENLFFFDEKKKAWVKPDEILGERIKLFGNTPFLFQAKKKNNGEEFWCISFPTKHNWWEKSDLKLIRESIKDTIELLKKEKHLFEGKQVYIPLFGTENGKLSLQEIAPLLKYFVDNLEELGFKPNPFTRKGALEIKKSKRKRRMR